MEFINSGRPPLAGWLGGKSTVAKQIIELLPDHSCYVEPFAGAAWILFRKTESKSEVINDINKDITTLYRVVKYHLEEFIRYFKWSLVARDEFERLKGENPESLTDIQRAARFYYLHHCSFNGRVYNQSFRYKTTGSPGLNLLRIEEQLSEAHLRLSRVYIECLPYSDLIERYDRPDTCFYVDPPYWGIEDYYGKNIFNREDYSRLAEQLKRIKGKFIMSINDAPEIRDLFQWARLEMLGIKYSCVSKGKKKAANELLIMNW